jgi:cell division septation protein DedD
MTEEVLHHEDQSHYEISLTAGQAFIAFVLLLLSLAASFAFGLMIGKGQADERLVVRKEPAVVTEGPAKKSEARLLDLGIGSDVAKTETTEPVTPLTESAPEAGAPTPAAAEITAPAPQPAAQPRNPETTQPVFAQVLSTLDQKTADTLAAKLIDAGFNSAYVERGATDKGTAFRVRVKFPSEADARAAETRLHEFSKDVWIVKGQ